MTSKDGYTLSKEGLSDMVKDAQRGFVEAYGGAEGLVSALGSDPGKGLSSDESALEKRREEFGSNYVEPPPIKSYWELIMDGLEDNTIQALLFCALVSILLIPADKEHADTSWIEGLAILITVLVVLNLQASIEYSKSKEFRRQLLELESEAQVNVVRDGTIKSVSPKTLVVGDVVRVAVGDVLAVDGVLIEGADVKIDESALTGESVLVNKTTEKDPFLLSGTNVMTGSGKFLAVAVGLNSVQGRILAAVQGKADVRVVVDGEEDPEDPSASPLVAEDESKKGAKKDDYNEEDGSNLAEKLNTLAIDIAKAGLTVATLIFFLMVAVMFALPKLNGPFVARRFLYLFKKVLDFFLVAVTILVVAVPEGLPLAVALSLAITMGKLMKDNNRVKHMEACETMGSATTICSDKTGTLTQNKMTVMRCYVGGDAKVFAHDTATNASVSAQILEASPTAFRDLVAQCAVLNSAPTSKVELKADGQWKYQGNATECALLKMATQLDVDPEAMRVAPDFQDAASKLEWGVKAFPFSSERKKMSWVIKKREGPGFRLMTKGAPSYVCDYASHAIATDGVTRVPFDRAAADAAVDKFQRAAMRTLALAYRDFDALPAGGWDALVSGTESVYAAECDVTLVCIVGIEDPLRPTVTRAIEQCNTAGVDVRMCTGDALETAVAISTQCGILRPMDVRTTEDGVIEPKPFFAMTGAEFDERVHEKDEAKDKIMRRAYDVSTNKVGEMLAYPFKRDGKGDKVIHQPAFDAVWPKLRVLARCQPEDKLTLVRGMRKSKIFLDHDVCAQLRHDYGIRIFPDHQVVAVTGDGTNDAPALKAANVGFAMGIVGTDIAKQACDIILLDDNFASTVAAVKWGRNVYDSIAKFCQFQLTVNISAIFVASLGAVLYNGSPLGAVQMLWVNVIMDSLASIALASEPPTDDLLLRQPYGKRRPMISGLMWWNMLGQFAYQAIVMCLLLFSKSFMQSAFDISNTGGGHKKSWSPRHIFIRLIYSLSDKKPEGWDHSEYYYQEHALKLGNRHFTIVFNTFVLMQLFNEFNSRKLQTLPGLKAFKNSEWNVFSGIFRNMLYVYVVVSTFILQILLVQFTGAFFKVKPLTIKQWGYCALFGIGSLPVQFVINTCVIIFVPDAESDDDDDKHHVPTNNKKSQRVDDAETELVKRKN